ncbi:MAG: J domain-containing protein [Bacteroidota bacterium]
MVVKDYYSILQLPPSASLHEIKKAYRKLAQQYHPDKHDNDPYKAVQFSQIKEAYEILSNPLKKNHYLQQRWYNQSIGKKFSGNEPITPPNILKQCLELNKYVSKLDIHRMDKEGLANHICDILSNETIEQLKKFHEPVINKTIIISILNTMERLEPKQTERINIQLYKLSEEDMESKKLISLGMRRSIKKERDKKIQPLIVLLITILICFIMYFVSR